MMNMPKVLNVTDAAALALHALVLIARNGSGMRSVPEIAETLRASQAHLSKVLQRLARAGLVRSTRGPAGGFELSRPAEKVSLLEVYEAIEGPLGRVDCLFPSRICTSGRCILGTLLADVNQEVRTYLSETMISEVTDVYGSE
jgi:Rrf2 family protein